MSNLSFVDGNFILSAGKFFNEKLLLVVKLMINIILSTHFVDTLYNNYNVKHNYKSSPKLSGSRKLKSMTNLRRVFQFWNLKICRDWNRVIF